MYMNIDFTILTQDDSRTQVDARDAQKNQSFAQKSLLIIRIACSIITLIPELKTVGIIGMRSILFAASSKACATSWSQDDALHRISKCAKLGALVLGITAVATGAPYMLVAAMVANIAIQIFDLGIAFHEGNSSKVPIHLGILVLITVLMTGEGSWPLTLLLKTIPVIAMAAMAVKAGTNARDWGDIVESVSYGTLAAVTLAKKVTQSEIEDPTTS